MKAFISLLGLVIAIGSVPIQAANSYITGKKKMISIEKAVKAGLIKLEIKGKGGHSGNCLHLKIASKHNDSLYIVLEAGRRLNSKNNSEQDILVTHEQIFALRAMEKKEADVYGFCCQASNHSPGKDSVFTVGRMADSSMIRLAEFCNKNKFPQDAVQNAVWCLSDNHNVAGIDQSVEKLRKFVCEQKHVEIPWYQKDYEQLSTSAHAFSNRTNKISGNINYTLTADCSLSIQLHDRDDKLMQKFTNDKKTSKGSYDYWFELQVTNWPKGKYFIDIYAGSQLIMKKEFEI
ncbi:MAG: hypothetical protein ACJ76F_00405 [Bacteroidia bacterium]